MALPAVFGGSLDIPDLSLGDVETLVIAPHPHPVNSQSYACFQGSVVWKKTRESKQMPNRYQGPVLAPAPLPSERMPSAPCDNLSQSPRLTKNTGLLAWKLTNLLKSWKERITGE